MEVTYRFSRDDWTAFTAETFRHWLHRLRPMTAEERVVGVLFLITSLLAVPALLAALAAGLWAGLAWHWIATAVLLLPLPCVMIPTVLWPSEQSTKRGLYHELIFAWGLEDRLVAAARQKHDRRHRRLEAAGRLELGQRYVLRLETEDLVVITTYPPDGGRETTQEDRRGWDSVSGVERADRLLLVHASDGTMLGVPRSAFAEGAEEGAFVRELEARRGTRRSRVALAVG